MPGWNFADVWEVVAQQVPDAPAQVQGDRRDHVGGVRPARQRRRPGLPRRRRRGAGQGRPVPLQRPRVPRVDVRAPSRPGLAPINTNYRYLDDELVYLWDNGDVVAVVFHGTFAERIEGIRQNACRGSSCGSGSTTAPARAPSGRRPTKRPPRPAPRRRSSGPWGRDGDHLLLLYTGGTTGMPKGVMWRQDDLFRTLVGTVIPAVRDADPDLQLIRDAVQAPGPHRPAGLPADARHRLLHPAHRAVGRRLQRHPGGPQPRHRRAVRDHRARVGQHHRHRGRRLRQADGASPRRLARASTTSPAWWSSRAPA